MTGAADWGRFVRTVRHLSARQIAARVALAARYRLYARFPKAAGIGLSGSAGWNVAGLESAAGWLAIKYPDALSPRRRELAMGAAERCFTFLNRTCVMGDGRTDWQASAMSRLWQYQLHYADYVTALAQGAQVGESAWAERALELIDDWIDGNPPGRRPGWEPYPLSLRVTNWIAALALLGPGVDEARRARIASSLAVQGRFLARHLEWHLGGNHLLKNAKALIVMGVALDCPEAASWRARGVRILLAEMRNQVLADGGHFERSPLYHGIVMEDLLDVLALASVRQPALLPNGGSAELVGIARRMTGWFARMRHPDGGLALFNDCVVAGEPDPPALSAYATRVLGCEPVAAGTAALVESGYYVLERGPGRAIIDCGDVGPDELPAHAHADTLSFELSWAGRRVIVNGGTAEYTLDDLRRYARSTAAHSTVRVDQVEQTEVWASHRVGRRARPAGARIVETRDHVAFTGAHDGYARLGVMHHRHVVATDQVWVVVDELLGRGRHGFESYLHLHPALSVERSGGEWRVAGDRGVLRVRPVGPVTGECAEGWYCPDWGQVVRAPILTFRGEGEIPAAFGFLVAPVDLDLEVTVNADATGVSITGAVGGRPLGIRSDRCTSSS